MSNLLYNATQPSSLKSTYGENDILDFIIKLPQGRSIVANSFRLSGNIVVSTNKGAITEGDSIHLDPFAGMHSIIRSVNTQVNNSTIENVQLYNRNVSMQRMATNNLESLNTSSLLLSEMCGSMNHFQLLGTTKRDGLNSASFSILPMIAINQSSNNLSSDKFQVIQISMTLANAVEAFYTDHIEGGPYMSDVDTAFTEIFYNVADLQLEWNEMMEQPGDKGTVIMPVKHLYQQSINNETSYLNITTPQLYNSLSVSFIEQSKRNTIFVNNLLCEKIKGLDLNGGALEIMINSGDTPIPYPIQTYQETALNYLKSLNGNLAQNCITNEFLNDTMSFGIGFSLMTSSNDRVAISLKINSEAYNYIIPAYDAFMYVNSFIQM
jgi:hypothetical protein